MPPGKHKSKLKTANAPNVIKPRPIPIFLSRQGSRVEGQTNNSNLKPNPLLSRQPSQSQMQEHSDHIDIQYNTRKFNVTLMVQQENKNYTLGDINCKLTDDNRVWIYDLIKTLKDMQIDAVDHLKNSTIQILNEEETQNLVNHALYTPNLVVYENLGVDPLNQDTFFKVNEDQIKLQLKIRPSKISLLDTILEQQPNEETNSKKNQKTKQRTLSQVVERVALWRRLYTGFYDQNKTFVQMSLDKAAEKVGISKKTLDDYLLQIRYGKRYGFDFKKNSNEGISKLRQFVKSKKENKKNDT
ncbi:unnamed protein product (macronuclear) [Paramecium tetraurelia]|uniref:Uncharacterized protein n=1 Tax=Paramecium tetraurelia TaxID=5888 RepID=A0CMR6_PARTE|nr:uncharacterized protein GSPATT00008562001 [Paramecium tetraurelia]CAK72083.1 unnamed protein product [Paramecium tetraurelia]|eukprot:XP_001439480.1 hypothetical protein (macronuclear) [Paramecium tetraurelia strain d4-2]